VVADAEKNFLGEEFVYNPRIKKEASGGPGRIKVKAKGNGNQRSKYNTTT
jgi:hypothetical protein